MKKLTVQLPDDLHKQVRILGIERGESFQAMVLRLLTDELARFRRAKKGLPRVEMPEEESSWHRPGRPPLNPSSGRKGRNRKGVR